VNPPLANFPVQDPTASRPLTRFAEGLWLDRTPVRFLGLRLTTTMVVLRLVDGSLMLYSPVELTPERRAGVEALGRVGHLYAPNLFHHRWIGQWAAAFPAARVHAPAGLTRKQPGLRVDRVHGAATEAAFAGVLEEISVEGFRPRETVLFHGATRTLVVADLVQNVGRPAHVWTAMYTRAMGFHDRVALSRALRWTAFDDRNAARRSLDGLLERGADRLVMGHGEPLVTGARDALAGAYAWLRR
jgi:hypothetical protein